MAAQRAAVTKSSTRAYRMRSPLRKRKVIAAASANAKNEIASEAVAGAAFGSTRETTDQSIIVSRPVKAVSFLVLTNVPHTIFDKLFGFGSLLPLGTGHVDGRSKINAVYAAEDKSGRTL